LKRVLITGASGIVLRRCLEAEDIGEVISIGRRTVNVENPKLKEIVRTDFNDYSDISAEFEKIDAAFFCLGAYTGSVSKEILKVITTDYAISFASMLKEMSPRASLSFLSGAGADRTEKSRTAFAKYKGMAENAIVNLRFDKFYIFRPAYIYPVEKRNEPNIMYSISRALYPLLKGLGEKYSITSEQLAEAMYQSAFIEPNMDTLENQDILNYLRSI